MESLRVPISKMKCILITQICFQFFVKAVAELSDFTVRNGSKAIRNACENIMQFFRFYLFIYVVVI